MFDKKIILLISLLLITGWSHIFFHYIKNNYNEVNFVDNSDSSINEDNIDTKKSISSLLFVIIIVIVIIIIAAAIFFFIFCRKTEEEEKPNSPEEIFEEYRYFKEVNEQKIARGTRKEIIERFAFFLQDITISERQDLEKNNKINNSHYDENKYFIDFAYPFANRELKKLPKNEENNKIIYRFNIKDNQDFFNKLLFKFFRVFSEEKYVISYQDIYKEYENYNFNKKRKKDKKESMFFFIATIIEPFFKAIKEKTYKYELGGKEVKLDFIFISRNDNDPAFLKSLFATMKLLLSSKAFYRIVLRVGGISGFFNYAINSDDFLTIFNQLIGLYFPSDFVRRCRI